MNIDELALRVAEKHRAPQGNIQMTATEFVTEIHALLAELSKDAEPVARICSGWQILFIGSNPIAELVRKHDLKIGDGLFTHPYPVIASEQKPNDYVQQVADHCDRIVWRNKYFHLPPPNTADIEQRTAEAIAKMAEDKDVERTDYCMHVYEEGEQYKSDLIADIKASKWRGYL